MSRAASSRLGKPSRRPARPRRRGWNTAKACVEILHVPEFCRRVQQALRGATFGGRPGHERIGHPVQYYRPDRPPEARWACPDLIACSKFDRFSWQDEFRLLFSVTEALRFENVRLRIVKGPSKRPLDVSQHHVRVVEVLNSPR